MKLCIDELVIIKDSIQDKILECDLKLDSDWDVEGDEHEIKLYRSRCKNLLLKVLNRIVVKKKERSENINSHLYDGKKDE